MNNANTLPINYHDIFVQEIKRYYMPLRIFSVWVFSLALIGLFGFVYNVMTNEAYSSGLFENPFIKAAMLIIALTFIGGIVIATFALVMLPIRKIQKAKQKKYTWKTGTLTLKDLRHRSSRLFIDNEICIPLGMKSDDYHAAYIGDGYIVIRLDSIRFAIKP